MNIVLVHGILGFRNLINVGYLEVLPYFRGVADRFKSQGDNVLAVELDKTKSVKFRGKQLGDQIQVALQPGGKLNPAEPTHIIAHSMGGLDSRYFLSSTEARYSAIPIRSLTTIATPHHGSRVADAVNENNLPQPIRDAITAGLKSLDISLEGLADLRKEACQRFEIENTNRQGVDYFSVTGIGRTGYLKTMTPLLPLYKYVLDQTQEENDGLVHRSSARWETLIDEWQADHADEIGYHFPLHAPFHQSFDHLPRYDAIRRRLANLP